MEDFICLNLANNTPSAAASGDVKLSDPLSRFLAAYAPGSRTLLGIPFLIASDAQGPAIKIAPGNDSAVTFPIEATARWLLIIHDAASAAEAAEDGRTDVRQALENPGNDPAASKATAVTADPREAARYTLHRADAPDIEQTIRLGLEIPTHGGDWGGPSLGTFSTSVTTPAQPGDGFATEQMGLPIMGGAPSPYRIFVWKNPEPDIPIQSIECANTSAAPITISAITVCNEPEHPVRDIPRTTLAVDFPGLPDVDLENVAIETDRGQVVRVEPLRPLDDAFFDSPRKGWGIDPVEEKSLRAEIYGPAGAAISIAPRGGPKGATTFGEALTPGPHDIADGKIRVEMLHPSKTWIHAKVVDEETGRPVTARVHFRGERGEYIPPAGHHRDVNTAFLEASGADVCLNGTNYAYVDGTFQINMPVGKVHVEAVRGFEYAPYRATLDIRPGQKELVIPIKRFINMNALGYYSGDTHVHFVTTQGGLLEAAGEDLDIMNILISQWGKLYTGFEEFAGAPSRISTDETIVYVNQENRQHTLGHINLLGLKRPVFPVCTGEAGEAWIGDAVEASQADWSRETKRQGGLVVQPHYGNNHGEYIPGAMLGYIDATEMAPMSFMGGQFTLRAYDNWYRLLNCGYKMPLVGGTDKMTNGACVGGCRGYVYTGTDRRLDYDDWCNGVRSGNTFTTTGPMLFLKIDDRPMGSTIRMSDSGGTVEVHADAIGYFPLKAIELIHCGRIIATQVAEENACSITLKTHVPIEQSGWLAVRCWGRDDVPGPRGVVAAHSSPIYVQVGNRRTFHKTDAHYLLEVIDDMMKWAQDVGVFRDPQKRIDVVQLFALSKHILHERLHAEGHTDHHHH